MTGYKHQIEQKSEKKNNMITDSNELLNELK